MKINSAQLRSDVPTEIEDAAREAVSNAGGIVSDAELDEAIKSVRDAWEGGKGAGTSWSPGRGAREAQERLGGQRQIPVIQSVPDRGDTESLADARLFIEMLREYSDQTQIWHDKCAHFSSPRTRRLYTLGVMLLTSFAFGIVMSFIRSNPEVVANGPSAQMVATIAVGVGGICAAWIMGTSRGERTVRDDIEWKTVRAKLSSSVERLRRVVRAASQYREHGVTNFATQMQLDFLLEDAEALLTRAEWVLERRKRP